MSQQPKIFISYRRVDEPDFVGRMYDHFVCRYGEENVFMDLDIPDFTRFEEHIIKEVDESDVLVAVIGPQWLELLKEKSESGKRDFVVMEIKRALDKGIMIAPICIKNAPVPEEKDDLPSGIRTRIQKMLDYQVSRVRGGSDFRDDMKKRIGFIDQRLKKLGYNFDTRTELDEILDQPLEELGNDIFELLEKGNILRIKKYLHDFPSYFLNKASEVEESQGDILKTLIDKIIVFGVVFIRYDQLGLYQDFLRTLQLIFKDAHERFRTPHTKHADETLRIWADLLPKLYLLGAILVQEGKYEWMSDFVKHPIPISWSSYYKGMFWMEYIIQEGMFWMRHMPENARIDYETFLKHTINIGKENSYFYQQFSDDEEKIVDCICQFDFIQCVYDQISMDIDHTPYPFFAQHYRERTVPIIQEIIKPQFRDMLFGKQLDDKKLAEIIRRLIHLASKFRTWRGRWHAPFPPEIGLFLEENPPSDDS